MYKTKPFKLKENQDPEEAIPQAVRAAVKISSTWKSGSWVNRTKSSQHTNLASCENTDFPYECVLCDGTEMNIEV